MQYKIPPNEMICAVLPLYTERGDYTKLLTLNGKYTLPVKASTIIYRLARRQAVDLYALKEKTSRLTNMRIWQPLIIASDLALTPVKIRKPKIAGDMTSGYINFLHITEMKAMQAGTELSLCGGHKVTSLWRKNTIENHLQKTHLAFLSFSRQNSAHKAFLKDKLFRIWLENGSDDPEKLLRFYAFNNI